MKFYIALYFFCFLSVFGQKKNPDIIELDLLTIYGTPPDRKNPNATTTFDEESFENIYAGQEMPSVVSRSPSFSWYSDNGFSSGYSYVRIRGIDQTRIHFSLDGIPLNDPEDHVLYLSNFPDLINSVRSIQLQRGVNINAWGGGGLAGSINFETRSLRQDSYVDLSATYGSYDTYRFSPEFSAGVIHQNWSFYGRYSYAGSDGFRDHSGTKGQSFFFNSAYLGDDDTVKFTALIGQSRIQLSYLALPAAELDLNDKSNPLSEEERDQFFQSILMLQHEKRWNDRLTFNSSIYHIGANGSYNALFSPDLYQFSLESHSYGGIFNLRWKPAASQVIFGLHANRYLRYHRSALQPFTSNLLYENTGHKNEISAFTKVSHRIGDVELLVDLQYRRPSFSYTQDKSTNFDIRPIHWNFFNSKLGLSYLGFKNNLIYTSVGRMNREPARNDLFAGFDNIDADNVDQIGDFGKVKPERVIDIELGNKYSTDRFYVDVNLYDMEFRDEIAPIGELSYIGLPLRKNVGRSYRRGIEVSANATSIDKLSITTTANLSKNKIKEYTTDFDTMTYRNVSPLLTPWIQATQAVDYTWKPWLRTGFEVIYTGKSYLDNTQNENFTVDASVQLNGSARTKLWEKAELSLLVNNILNSKYYTAGYVQSNTTHFYPMAGRNFLATFQQRF